jgi:hypothetical protein
MTHHCVHLDVKKRIRDMELILEQPIGSYDCFSITYGKTFLHGLSSCSARLNSDFDNRTLFVSASYTLWAKPVAPYRSTLAYICFGRVFTTQTKRISPTTTRTSAAWLVLTSGRVGVLVSTPSRVVARYGRSCPLRLDVIQVDGRIELQPPTNPTSTRILPTRRILTMSRTMVRSETSCPLLLHVIRVDCQAVVTTRGRSHSGQDFREVCIQSGWT